MLVYAIFKFSKSHKKDFTIKIKVYIKQLKMQSKAITETYTALEENEIKKNERIQT